MIPILITIIIITVFIELYLRYYDLIFNYSSVSSDNNIDSIDNNDIWDKVVACKGKILGDDKLHLPTKQYTKYYIKIINNNIMPVFIEWKLIINKNKVIIDYDIDNNYLIVKTKSEEEALSIVNLFISNLNNEIELTDIIENNLINISKRKATSHKLVKIKIIELIKNGLKKMECDNEINNNVFDTNDIIEEEDNIEYFNNMKQPILVDTNEEHIPQLVSDTKEFANLPIQNEVIPDVIYNNNPFDKIMTKPFISGYGGSEYSNILF